MTDNKTSQERACEIIKEARQALEENGFNEYRQQDLSPQKKMLRDLRVKASDVWGKLNYKRKYKS